MIIAKTRPEVETLKEHTEELLQRFKILKAAYGFYIPNENVWKLLEKAAFYHDFGKINNDFQGKMNKALKTGKNIPVSMFGYIPHSYLSPFFLPINKWDLSKAEQRIIIQAIAYHHERNMQPDVRQLRKIYEQELIHHIEKLQAEMDAEMPDGNQKVFNITHFLKPNQRIKELQDREIYFLYILIKGLLHRLDHAASAHVPIEIDTDFNIANFTRDYMENTFGVNALRPLQKFTFSHQDQNLIIVARTGMGKTEASLLWAGKVKSFFTLPIRVSLNALFNRVYDEMGYKQVGLLHGNSAAHLDESGIERWEMINDQSRNFANKLLFTTVDQILKFPFKYKGYEKMFATMSYSKVIIDEIQAYNPWMVAVIIRAIEMIHQIGGRFMIMTATLPQIYLDELKERNIIDDNCLYKEFVDETFVRHRISIETCSILDDCHIIEQQAENKKVLIIVNTVDRAIEIYNSLQGSHLLHSRFIQKDRALLEKEIKRFAEEDDSGIWVTTQLVEASLDIDFDILYTELSTIDSLLQRFGRCYRKRELNHSHPNVHIYTSEVSGEGSVYDKDILELTNKELQVFDDKIINEQEKIDLVKRVYSKEALANTKFYHDFRSAIHKLENVEDYYYTEDEAQNVLRNIDSVRVIPRGIYDGIIDMFEAMEIETNTAKRTKLRREIERHVVSVPRRKFAVHHMDPIDFYQTGKDGRKYSLFPDVYILDVDYFFDVNNLSGIGLATIDDSNPMFL